MDISILVSNIFGEGDQISLVLETSESILDTINTMVTSTKKKIVTAATIVTIANHVLQWRRADIYTVLEYSKSLLFNVCVSVCVFLFFEKIEIESC